MSVRAWRDEDAPAVAAACNDPEIGRWTHVPYPYGERDAHAFLMAVEPARRAGRELHLAIAAADDGRLIGSVGLARVDRGLRTAEIGYWVARGERRAGHGARAVRLLSRWAIDAVGIERLELLAHPENEPSQRLALAAGFTREGTLRQYRRRKGRREDLVMFSLLPDDV